MATNAAGDYVVVWVTYGQGGDAADRRQHRGPAVQPVGQAVGDAVRGEQLHRRQPDRIPTWRWTPTATSSWFGRAQGTDDLSGVYARVYDSYGVAIRDQFLREQSPPSIQNEPSVAMDANGDFVVTWTSYGQDSDRDGIFARRFNVQGKP